MPEGRRIFPRLTVDENLQVGAYPSRARAGERQARDRVYSLFPRLAERRRQAGGSLSGGEQQMLAFGRAMMAQPVLLLLDEPSLGLAPILVEEVASAIESLPPRRRNRFFSSSRTPSLRSVWRRAVSSSRPVGSF